MKSSNLPVALFGAAATFAVALGLRFMVDNLLPQGYPFLTFFPAVLIVTYIFGTLSGIVMAVLGFFASWYFFLPPFFTFSLSKATSVAMSFYVFIAATDIFILSRLIRVSELFTIEKGNAVRLSNEKEVLYAEMQHRIGNNLQAISSLLQIQSRTVADPEAKRALTESVQRVSIVADIQRRFNSIRNRDGIMDNDFVKDLARSSIEAAGVAGKFDLEVHIEPTALTEDKFLAVSLVLTECVNNCLEHALPTCGGRRKLRVNLSTESKSGWHILEVADDGQGLPDGFDPTRTSSIGMKVILSFARQIGGEFTIVRDQGTVCRLTFPL